MFPAQAAPTACLAAFTLLVFMASSLLLAGPATADSGDVDNHPGITQPGELEPAPVPPAPEGPAPVDPPPYTPPPYTPPPVAPPADPAPAPYVPPVELPADLVPAPEDQSEPVLDPATGEPVIPADGAEATTEPSTAPAATPSATPTPPALPTAAPATPGNVDSETASATSDVSTTPRWLQLAVIVLLLAIFWAYTRFMRRGSRHLNSATASEETK